MALNTTFDEVIEMNVDKLKARYPGGEFDVHKSENRQEGRLMKDLKVPFAIVSFLLVQGAGAVWWASQVDGRVKNLETQSLNIAREIVDTLNRWFNHHMVLVLHGVINTMMNGSKREDGNDYY